jgi:transcription elongation factor GreA
MTEETFLTAEGFAKLQEELEYLRTVRRQEIAEQIRDAKEGGDITENAGYEQAKEDQAFVEGRIMTLEKILRTVVIIEENGPSDRVELGSRVTVVEVEDDKRTPPETYRIVGPTEANPLDGSVSYESPLGRALIGRTVGDSVSVSAPTGEILFEITDID